MKINLLTLLLLGFVTCSYAQMRRISTSAETMAQQVPGFSEVSNTNQKSINYNRDINARNQSIKSSSVAQAEGLRPAKYGDRIAVDINTTDGNITNTSVGQVWTLELNVPNAANVGFSFEKFDLSEDAEMYIFNEQKTVLDTAIKKAHFTTPKHIGIAPFNGSKITIYILERGNRGVFKSSIWIKEVIAGIAPFLDAAGAEGRSNALLTSASINCIPLLSCDPSKLASARSVAKITVGGYTGTGTLINNESNDGRPYFLTAFHVIDLNDNGSLDQYEVDALASANFLFQYWYVNCSYSNLNGGISFTGAILKAISTSNDFVLLELLNPPGIGDFVNYSGWNRKTSAAADYGSYIIHHPDGQDMRLSTTSSVVTWLLNGDSWDVHYNNGVVAPGSSGAALFNEDGQVVGQLKSGLSSCNFTDFGDQYPKFDRSWSLASLSGHLSPSKDLQSTSLLNLAEIPIYGPEMISCTTPTEFSTFSSPLSGVTYEWSVGPGLQIVSGQGTPVINLSGIAGSPYGSSVLTLTLRSPNKGLNRTLTLTKNVRIYGGYVNGTYTSPTDEAATLMPTTKFNVVYNEACMGVKTNISVPAGAIVEWHGGSPGGGDNVTMMQSGKDAYLYFTALNQIGYLTVRVTTACNTVSTAYNFKCVSTNSCGVIPMFAAPETNPELLIYPNPVGDELRIGKRKDADGVIRQLPKAVSTGYKIYSEKGRLVRAGNAELQNGDMVINTSDVDNGKYFIHIIQEGKTIKKQIVVAH